MNRTRSTLAALTAAALLVVPAAPAMARDDVVRRDGGCSSRSVWELKGHHDDGRLEIEYEVDTPRIGQNWNVRLTDNGNRIYRRVRTTTAPSGSFTVDIRRANLTGTDVIRARAVNQMTGEICRGRIDL